MYTVSKALKLSYEYDITLRLCLQTGKIGTFFLTVSTYKSHSFKLLTPS